MDFESLLKSSWSLFLKGIVKLILFTLVGAVLCMTIILIPTVVAGWFRAILAYVREGAEPDYSELWNFEDFVQVLLFLVVGGLLMSVGYMLLVVPGVILNVWWLYTVFFIVDKKLGFWEAMKASREMVTSAGFMQHFIVFLIVAVLNSIGSALSGLGTLISLPITIILMTLVYLGPSALKSA